MENHTEPSTSAESSKETNTDTDNRYSNDEKVSGLKIFKYKYFNEIFIYR